MTHIEITGEDLLRVMAHVQASYPIASLRVKQTSRGASFNINNKGWTPLVGTATGEPEQAAEPVKAPRPSASRNTRSTTTTTRRSA